MLAYSCQSFYFFSLIPENKLSFYLVFIFATNFSIHCEKRFSIYAKMPTEQKAMERVGKCPEKYIQHLCDDLEVYAAYAGCKMWGLRTWSCWCKGRPQSLTNSPRMCSWSSNRPGAPAATHPLCNLSSLPSSGQASTPALSWFLSFFFPFYLFTFF